MLHFYREYSSNAPDELTAYAFLLTTPDGHPAIAIPVGWFGPLAEGEKHFEPLRRFGSPLADLVGPMPYTQLQSLFDAAAPCRWNRRIADSGEVTVAARSTIRSIRSSLSSVTCPDFQ